MPTSRLWRRYWLIFPAAALCFLGDAVNMDPFPAETVELIRSLRPAFRVRGNHARYAALPQ